MSILPKKWHYVSTRWTRMRTRRTQIQRDLSVCHSTWQPFLWWNPTTMTWRIGPFDSAILMTPMVIMTVALLTLEYLFPRITRKHHLESKIRLRLDELIAADMRFDMRQDVYAHTYVSEHSECAARAHTHISPNIHMERYHAWTITVITQQCK